MPPPPPPPLALPHFLIRVSRKPHQSDRQMTAFQLLYSTFFLVLFIHPSTPACKHALLLASYVICLSIV